MNPCGDISIRFTIPATKYTLLPNKFQLSPWTFAFCVPQHFFPVGNLVAGNQKFFFLANHGKKQRCAKNLSGQRDPNKHACSEWLSCSHWLEAQNQKYWTAPEAGWKVRLPGELWRVGWTVVVKNPGGNPVNSMWDFFQGSWWLFEGDFHGTPFNRKRFLGKNSKKGAFQWQRSNKTP